MEKKNDIKSVLKLDRLVFDVIRFTRKGFKNDNQLEFTLQASVTQKQDLETYRVCLSLKGDKSDEYDFEICLSGYFSYDITNELADEQKKDIISKNTLSILMPYLRSQVSLLTAQPETDCVVLPPFNINSIVEGFEE